MKYDPLDVVDKMKEQIEQNKNPKRSAAPRESRKSPEGQEKDQRLQHEWKRNN